MPHRSPAASQTARRRTAGPSRKTAHKKASARHVKPAAKRAEARRWSQGVTESSDALDLRHGVFTLKDPARIAASLKRSAEHSKRRKTDAFRSAMSMLTFYINRAGRTLPQTQRARLERTKGELRRQFGR